MADLSERYEARWNVSFVHPSLVRCSVTYWPKPTRRGPILRTDFVVTPDGVLATTTKASPGELEWGVTWPLLVNDGAASLPVLATSRMQSVGYTGRTDRQNFIALDGETEIVQEKALRGSYGDVTPVRVLSSGEVQKTFVYPSGAGDPDGVAVRDSFSLPGDGFRSVLGRVSGDIYVGRTSAGGFGKNLDVEGDGTNEVEFTEPCGFLAQLSGGHIVAVETDRAVQARFGERTLTLAAHTPMVLSKP